MKICVLARSTTKHFETGGMESQLKILVEGLSENGHEVYVITTSYPAEKVEEFLADSKTLEVEEGLGEKNKLDKKTSDYVNGNSSLVSHNKDHNVVEYDVRYVEKKVKYIYIGGTTSGLRPVTKWEKIFHKFKVLNRQNPEGNKNYYDESYIRFKELDEKVGFDVVISQSTIGIGVLKGVKESLYRKDRKDMNIGENEKTKKIWKDREDQKIREVQEDGEEKKDNDGPKFLSVIHGTIFDEIKNRATSNKNLKNWIRYILVDLPVWIWEYLTSNKYFFKNCDQIIAVSDTLKDNFLKEHPYCANKTTRIYNGVDNDIFKPGEKKYRNFTLLYIGRLDREKGVDISIKTVKYLLDRGLNCQLLLIGSGIQKHIEEFKKTVDELQLSKHIHFEGKKLNTELVSYYQMSHVFIFPTLRKEGHPVVLSESFCSGLPMVAFKSGGLSELITDGKDGYLVDIRNIDQFHKKVEYLIQNDIILKEMSDNAYKKGVQLFGKNAMFSKYESVISDLIKK